MVTKQVSSVTPEALKFYKQAVKTMEYLAGRWVDESQYEDIADYQVPLDKVAKKCGVKIVKMLKRPFGCEFTVGPKRFKLTCGQQYRYQRIG